MSDTPIVTGIPSRWERLCQRLELPVFTKEMRARMRDTRLPMLLFYCTASTILAVVLCCEFPSNIYGGELTDNMGMLAGIGKGLSMLLFYLEGGFVVMITPALTAATFSGEREQQTLEALLFTPLSSRNIIMGKLLSALSSVLLILLSTLPVMAVSLYFGGVSPAQIAWSLALILATALFSGTIGLYCSINFRRTITAVSATYIICLCYLFLIPSLITLLSNRDVSSELLYPDSIWLPFCVYLPAAMIGSVMAIPLVGLISIVYTRRFHRHFTVRMHRTVWMATAILISMIVFSAMCFWRSFNAEIFLFGNPIIAMLEQWGNDFWWHLDQALSNWMAPVTVGLLLLYTWITLMMAERLLDMQLGDGMLNRTRGKDR